ncbi:hypothetical protein ACRAVF_19235 [Bradyrhizobium oligotrophicum S58]
MYATVVAVMCHLLTPHPTIAPEAECTAEEARVEEIVTDTDLDTSVDMFSCLTQHQAGVAEWKSKHRIYFQGDWRVARIKCVPGVYQLRGSI